MLLFDEPLSNLDAKLRERMRFELRELQRRLRITTLYVTHDQIEALSMSNVIAVMNSGVIVQEGGPRDIYLAPEEQVRRQLHRFDQSDARPGDQVEGRRHGAQCAPKMARFPAVSLMA